MNQNFINKDCDFFNIFNVVGQKITYPTFGNLKKGTNDKDGQLLNVSQNPNLVIVSAIAIVGHTTLQCNVHITQ